MEEGVEAPRVARVAFPYNFPMGEPGTGRATARSRWPRSRCSTSSQSLVKWCCLSPGAVEFGGVGGRTARYNLRA